MKKVLKTIAVMLLTLLIILFLIRLTTPKEIDDVSPEISCEPEYINKATTLWIIPKFNGHAISEDPTWCKEILALNKTIGMHGFEHYYHEWDDEKTSAHINESIEIWQECFNETPILFKAPNLALSKQNRELVESYNLTIKSYFNQEIHKVYHCEDSGTLPNWFHDLF